MRRHPTYSSADRKLDAALAQVVESISSRLAQDMADDEKGWQKLGSFGTEADLSAQEREDIRKRCISLWRISGDVAQALNLLRSGTFGQGLSVPQAVDKRVQKIVDRFWSDADNQLALFSRDGLVLTNLLLALEGERFLTLHTSPADSQVKLADLPVGEISEVIPHPDNRRLPVLYRRVFRPTVYDFQSHQWRTAESTQTAYYRDWRWTEAALADNAGARALVEAAPNLQEPLIYHVRVNTIGLRGVPTVWRAYDWSRAHHRALSDLATLTKTLAMFAWRKKVRTSSAAALERSARKLATPAPGTGSTYLSNDRVELDPIDVGTGGTQNMASTARHTHLEAIKSFGFGEHWYGDASTGNLATAAAMELPAIWTIADNQQLFRQMILDLIGFAIDRAADDPAFVRLPQSVDRYVDVDFPPAQPHTPAMTAQLLSALALASGVLIDEREASYQAYLALGSNDVEKLMERQYPPEQKLEDQVPEPETTPANEGQVVEAVHFRPSKLQRQFASALQAGVIDPWRRQLRQWLESLETPPERGELASAISSQVPPDKAALSTLLWRYRLEAYNAGGQQALDKLQQAQRRTESVREAAKLPGFNLRDPKLLGELRRTGRQITGEITQTMLEDLHAVLQIAFYDEGRGPREVARELDEIFPRTYANRAETIARTETAKAQGQAGLETYRRNGVEKRQWVSMGDDKVRDDHAAADGQMVGMDEPFVVGGEEVMYPGDGGGDQAINCRCDVVPVIDETAALREVPWTGGSEEE